MPWNGRRTSAISGAISGPGSPSRIWLLLPAPCCTSLMRTAIRRSCPTPGRPGPAPTPTVGIPGPAGHTIEAYDENNLLVGIGFPGTGVAFSTNGGTAFAPFTEYPAPNAATSGMHVLFDADFATNQTVYAASDDPCSGRINRNKISTNFAPWTDLMGACGGHMYGYFGLAQTNSKNVSGQGTLYGAHGPNPCCMCTG